MGVKKMIITLSAEVHGINPDMPECKSMLPEPASPYAPSLTMFFICVCASEDFVIYEDGRQSRDGVHMGDIVGTDTILNSSDLNNYIRRRLTLINAVLRLYMRNLHTIGCGKYSTSGVVSAAALCSVLQITVNRDRIGDDNT